MGIHAPWVCVDIRVSKDAQLLARFVNAQYTGGNSSYSS
jgi:hypothetical protein